MREQQALFALAVDSEEEELLVRKQYIRYRKHEDQIAIAINQATRFLAEGGADLFLASKKEKDKNRRRMLCSKKARSIHDQDLQLMALEGQQINWRSEVGHKPIEEVYTIKQTNLSKVMGALVKQFGYAVMTEELELVPARAQLLNVLKKRATP